MRNAGCMDWTDAAIARLKELWGAGFSASECGQRMGVSRNSIIGKIHRLGLSGKYRRPREGRPRMRARAKPAAHLLETPEMPQMRTNKLPLAFPAPPSPPLPPPDPPVGAFDLLELRHGMCRYPSGDRVPFRFCGAPVEDGYPYCPEHAAACYNKHPARAAA